jgi:hypothetical protein
MLGPILVITPDVGSQSVSFLSLPVCFSGLS